MGNNEFTKLQIKNWLENAVKNAQNPDPKEQIRRQRQEKNKVVKSKYGL